MIQIYSKVKIDFSTFPKVILASCCTGLGIPGRYDPDTGLFRSDKLLL